MNRDEFRFLLGYGPPVASAMHWRLRWVSISEEGCCRIVNLDDLEAVKMLPCAPNADIRDWHPYEAWLVMRQARQVVVWDAERARTLAVVETDRCLVHQFSTDGCWLFLLLEDGSLRRWAVTDWVEHEPVGNLDIVGFRCAKEHLVAWNQNGLLSVRSQTSPEAPTSQFALEAPLMVSDVSPDGRWAHVLDATSTYVLNLVSQTLTPLLDRPVPGLFSWASTHLFLRDGNILVLDLESMALAPSTECWEVSRTGHCARTEGHFHDHSPPLVLANCLLPSPQARLDSVDCFHSLLLCWDGVLVYGGSSGGEVADCQTVWHHDVPHVTLRPDFLGWDGDVEWSRISHMISRDTGEYRAVENPHRESGKFDGNSSPHLDYLAHPAVPLYGQRYECRTVFKAQRSFISEKATGRSRGVVEGRFNRVNERFALAWIPPGAEHGWVRFQDSSPFARPKEFKGYRQGDLHPREDQMLISDGRRTLRVGADGGAPGSSSMDGWYPRYSPSGEFFCLLFDDGISIHGSDTGIELSRLPANLEPTAKPVWLNERSLQIGAEIWHARAEKGGWTAPSLHEHCYSGTVLADGFSDLAMERRNGQCRFFSLSTERLVGTLHPMLRHWFFFTPEGLYEGSVESSEFVLGELDPRNARPGLMGRTLRLDQSYDQELRDLDAEISELCAPQEPFETFPRSGGSGPVESADQEGTKGAPPVHLATPRQPRQAVRTCPACSSIMRLDQGATSGWGEFFCCDRCKFTLHEHADPAQIERMVREHRRQGYW